jgi:hypothetical protein
MTDVKAKHETQSRGPAKWYFDVGTEACDIQRGELRAFEDGITPRTTFHGW